MMTDAEVGKRCREIIKAGGNDQTLSSQLIDFLINHDKPDVSSTAAEDADDKPKGKAKRA